MIENLVILDQELSSNTISISNPVTNCRAFLFDTPNLSSNIEAELGFNIFVTYNGIGRSLERDVITTGRLLFNNLNTFICYNIPSEYLDTGLSFRVAVNSSEPIFLRIYALVETTTTKDIVETIDTKVDTLLLQSTYTNTIVSGLVVNQLAQNTALGLLGTSLSPITAGVSAGVVPILTGGTNSLIGLPLLPTG